MNDRRFGQAIPSSSADTLCCPSSIIVDNASSHPSSSAASTPLTPPPTPPAVFSPCQVTFREAVQNGNTSELQRLLEEREGKINVNLFDKEGQTALHHCCFKGNLELVKLLERKGVILLEPGRTINADHYFLEPERTINADHYFLEPGQTINADHYFL